MRAAPLVLMALLVSCAGTGSDADPSTDGGPPQVDPDAVLATGDLCDRDRWEQCPGGLCLKDGDEDPYCSESCDDGICPLDLVCEVRQFGGNLLPVCARPCVWNDECPSGICQADGRCAPVSGTADEGDACGQGVAVCEQGLFCTGPGTTSLCMATCDPAADAFCPSGALCRSASTSEGGVCWIGGDVSVGSPCDADYECALGTVCIVEAGAGRCLSACDPADGDPGCAAGVCAPVPDRSYGFCQE